MGLGDAEAAAHPGGDTGLVGGIGVELGEELIPGVVGTRCCSSDVLLFQVVLATGQPAVALIRASLLVVWLQLGVSGPGQP
jgi:hypothetical protein